MDNDRLFSILNRAADRIENGMYLDRDFLIDNSITSDEVMDIMHHISEAIRNYTSESSALSALAKVYRNT